MPAKLTVSDFWGRVTVATGCWEWRGPMHDGGYGTFGHTYAHRFSYELVHGRIPAGLQIDHLCRNRRCVNPGHLEELSEAIPPAYTEHIGIQLLRVVEARQREAGVAA